MNQIVGKNMVENTIDTRNFGSLPILKYFRYEHLRPELQTISKPFCLLAEQIATRLSPDNGAETTVALRKLLESKDAAVRAAL